MPEAQGASGIPGTEAITEKIKGWQKVNTQEFTDVQNSLHSAAEQAGSSHKQLQGTISSLSAAWRGKDADSYRGYMQTFADASKAAHQLLTEGVKSVQGAVRELDAAKREMKGAIDHIVEGYDKDVKKLKGEHGGPPSNAQKEELGQKLSNEVQGKVDEAVSKAQDAMKKLSTALSKQTSQMQDTYTGVPSPGTTAAAAPAHSSPVAYSNGGGGGASAGGGGGGGAGASGGPPSGSPPGNVKQWIDKAVEELKKAGVNVSDSDKKIIWQIIDKESGGDPHAMNDWDSNAQKGTPSKGLMQCIDPTFQSNKLPGHGDIYNPVDNICAGVKYSISRYGSLSNVPGIQSMSGGGGYVGY